MNVFVQAVMQFVTDLGCRAMPLEDGEPVVVTVVVPAPLVAQVVAEAEVLCAAAAVVDQAAAALYVTV